MLYNLTYEENFVISESFIPLLKEHWKNCKYDYKVGV